MLTGQGANIGLAKVEWGWRLSYGWVRNPCLLS